MCYVCDNLVRYGITIEQVRAKRECEDLSFYMLYSMLAGAYFGTLPFLSFIATKQELRRGLDSGSVLSGVLPNQLIADVIGMQQQDWLKLAASVRAAWIALMCYYVKYYPSFLVIDAVIDKISQSEYSSITH